MKKYCKCIYYYIWNLVVSVSVTVLAESIASFRVLVLVSDLNQNSDFSRSYYDYIWMEK